MVEKHTPGPWSAISDPMHFDSRTDVADAKGGMIASICGVNPARTVFEMEANARLIAAAPKLKDALAAMLDFWGGYECTEVDAAIAVMQELGEDRWSMQAQMDAAKADEMQK